jgi:cation diffusion facilitator family transporter
MKVNRIQSIRYVGEDEKERPVLRFNSIERGGLNDDDEQGKNTNSNLFMYNSEEDVYRINSLKRSRLAEKDSNPNLEIYKEEDFNANINKNETGDEDDIQGGNVIFANSLNIDSKEKKLTPLYLVMLAYLAFCLIEVTFGYYSNSITLMADAAHYFSESSCFLIFIVSIYVSRKKATNSMSFGFHRGEILGVLVRATFLLGFSFWLIYYVSLNFIRPSIVNGLMIIIVGIMSTFFNLIMGLVLIFVGINNGISFSEKVKICHHQHSKDELNCDSTRKTYTSVIYKAIQSCIIIVAGVFVYFMPSIKYIDPSCTLVLTGLLLYNAYDHMGGVLTILMEGSPLEFDVEGLKKDLLKIDGVTDVHDIHVWSLSIGKISMSCHLTTSEPQNSLILASDLIKKNIILLILRYKLN